MAPFAPLMPLLLGAMTAPALAMTVDCGSTPSSADGSVPWVQSWMPPVLRHQFLLSPPNAHQAHQSTALDSGHEQPLATTGEGEEPGFCPL